MQPVFMARLFLSLRLGPYLGKFIQERNYE
jgi:hypothetical protein